MFVVLSSVTISWKVTIKRELKKDAPTRDRTEDLSVNSRTLYQLSHGGRCNIVQVEIILNFFSFVKCQSVCHSGTLQKCRGTLSERLRRQIRNLLGFARAGSNPAGVVLFDLVNYFSYCEMVQWPSGLRRSTQVRVSSEAWVRTPLEPHFFDSVFFECMVCFECTPRTRTNFLEVTLNDWY